MAKQQSDTGDGVHISNGDGTADSERDTYEMSLAEKLAAVRAEASGIGKDDIRMQKGDKAWTIKGHTVEAVLSEMRPLLDRYRIGLLPQLHERTYNGNRCDVLVDFEFQCLDDLSVTRVIRWAGAGTDAGDKGFSKAGTNALKEMLKKVFLITDRDDAKEEEEKVEHVTDDQISAERVKEAQEETRQAVEAWATNFRATLKKCTTAAEVKAAERDNRAQLASPKLPAVTRDFFVSEIETLKQELP